MNDDRSGERSPHHWARLGGPLLTAALVAFIELAAGTPLRLSNPPALLMLAIVVSAFGGGLGAGLVSAALSWAYTAYFFSRPGEPFRFDEENLRRVVLWGLTMPLTAVLVGLLNRRAARALAAAELAALRQAGLEESARAAAALRESEYRLEAAQRMAHVGWWERDLDTGRLTWSEETYRILGLTPGKPALTPAEFLALIHPEDRGAMEGTIAAALGGGPRYDAEYRVVRPGGEVRFVHSQADLTRDEAGRPRRLFGTIQDVTDRRRAEEALRESEERFRAFMAHNPAAGWIVDRAGRVHYLSPGYFRLFDLDEQDYTGRTVGELWGPDLAELYTESNLRMLRERHPLEAVEPARRKDGSLGEFLVVKFPISMPDGELLAGGIALDVTDLKRTERALRESEELYRLLAENSHDRIYLLDLEGRVVYASPSVARQLGRVSTDLLDGLHPDDVEAAGRAWGRILAGEKVFLTNRVRHADGSWRWQESWGAPVHYRGRPHVMGVCRDVTERKEAEDRLRRTAEELERVMASVSDYLWSGEVDEDGKWRYHYYSPVVERITGRPPSFFLEGPERWLETVHPDDRPRLVEAFRRVTAGGTGREEAEYRAILPDGEVRWVRDCASVTRVGRRLRVDGVVSDITERKRAEEAVRRSEASLARAQRIARLGDWEQQLDPDRLRWSDEVFRIFGVDPGEFSGTSEDFFRRVHPDDAASIRAAVAEALRLRRPYSTDHRIVRPDGTVLYVHEHAEPVYDEAGRATALVGTVQDVTERKKAEMALTLFRSLIDHTTDAIEVVDPETGRFLDVNESACRAHGYTRGEYLALRVPDLDPAAGGPDAWARKVEELRRSGSRVHEGRHRRKDGSIFPVEVSTAYIRLDRDYLTAVVRDVTERKRAEEELREGRERLRLAVQAAGLGPWDWDLRMGAVDFSPEWKRQLGYEEHEIPGRYEEWETRLHPDDRERVLGALRDYLEGLRPDYAVEFRLRHRDGSYRWIYTRAVALWDEGGKPYRMIGCHLDVTERKRAEEAIRESHGLLNAVVEGTSDAVFVKDPRGRYLLVNSAAAHLLGRPAGEILGKGDRELLTAEAARAAVERDDPVVAAGIPQTLEETATVAGTRRTYLTTRSPFRDARGQVVGLVGIARDVTELKLLEEQYLQAQKMEAVGRLAGGVAHDFNNLLTVISGYGQMVYDGLRPDDPRREPLAEVLRAGERAATLTRQLLAFSRKQVLQPQVVNLNALLGELLKLLQRLIGEDIDLALVAGSGLGLARVDPGQFEQAVINLAVNARDAMPSGGRLSIETRNADLGVEYADRHPDALPGRYVLMAVTDTGCGMDEATRAQVFEPFFTTKGPGKGTGLGLAMVYGFVKQSGGHVEVESEVGRGTAFRLFLPRADAAPAQPKSASDLLKMPRGSETVLLVEDEDAVRSLARVILQSCGYTVLEGRDGQDGLRVAGEHPGPIRLLVTDLVMPRMSGRQLADLLAQSRPDLRILFMSGYTDEVATHHGVLESGLAFLQKPFSPLSLARKAREVLDS